MNKIRFQKYSFLIATAIVCFLPAQLISQINQGTKGDCSPTIVNRGGDVKINIKGCKGISPEILARWKKELNSQFRQLIEANASQSTAVRKLAKELNAYRRQHEIDAKTRPNGGNYDPETNPGLGVENRFVKIKVNSINRNALKTRLTISLTVINKTNQDMLIMYYKSPTILGNDGSTNYAVDVNGINIWRGSSLTKSKRRNFSRILAKGSATVNLVFKMSGDTNADSYSFTARMAIYDSGDPGFPIEFGGGIANIRMR